MKTLNENSYKYLGTKDCWHVFASKQTSFDPEVLFLYRARMKMNDGTSRFFDPILKKSDDVTTVSFVMVGQTSDNNAYCMTVEIDKPLQKAAVCVSESRPEERSPKRIVARA